MSLNVSNVNAFANSLNDWSLAGVSVSNKNEIIYNPNIFIKIAIYVKDVFLNLISLSRIIEWNPKKNVYVVIKKNINEMPLEKIVRSK